MATSPRRAPLALAGPLTEGVEQQPQGQHRQRAPPADEKEGGDQQQDGLQRDTVDFSPHSCCFQQSSGDQPPPIPPGVPHTRFTAAISPPGLILRA